MPSPFCSKCGAGTIQGFNERYCAAECDLPPERRTKLAPTLKTPAGPGRFSYQGIAWRWELIRVGQMIGDLCKYPGARGWYADDPGSLWLLVNVGCELGPISPAMFNSIRSPIFPTTLSCVGGRSTSRT